MDEIGRDELETLLAEVRREVDRRRAGAAPIPWPPSERERRPASADWPRIVEALELAASLEQPSGWRRLLTPWRELRRRRETRRALLLAVQGLAAGLQELERRESELRVELAAAEEAIHTRSARLESEMRNVELGLAERASARE
jgi:hypothetical protein